MGSTNLLTMRLADAAEDEVGDHLVDGGCSSDRRR
jgi:hypothetical protein